MPLLPPKSSLNDPSVPTLSDSAATSHSPFDDASIKRAQAYWTADGIVIPPSLSNQQIRAELSGRARRDPEAERNRQRWVQVKNRRRRWLDRHPDYVQGSELESADPLLYDRLVRRFQSTTEREAEGKNKGFAGTVAASILRGEARIEEARIRQEQGLEARHPMDENKLAHIDHNDAEPSRREREREGEVASHFGDQQDENNQDREHVEDIDSPWTGIIPDSKEDALRQWQQAMSARFLDGQDNDFDYKIVDDDPEWDDHEEEERRRMEDWFDDEEPSWGTPGSGDEQAEKVLTGETGVQDY